MSCFVILTSVASLNHVLFGLLILYILVPCYTIYMYKTSTASLLYRSCTNPSTLSAFLSTCVSKHFGRIANYCYLQYAVTYGKINLFMSAGLTFLRQYAMPSLRPRKIRPVISMSIARQMFIPQVDKHTIPLINTAYQICSRVSLIFSVVIFKGVLFRR